MHYTPAELIHLYQLKPHPEGGYYNETYRSSETFSGKALPQRFTGDRYFSTAIYFLLVQGNFSVFHRIKSDECWHFYAGQTLNIYIISADSSLQIVRLGNNIRKGEVFQFVVPANAWFASAPDKNSIYSFVGCTVSPGFDFTDFEIADRSELIKLFPQHKDLVTQLTRK